jgi:energy-converting hydrogenase B subunit D
VTLELLFDTVLGLMLIWLAWRVLASPDLFKAVVLFIVFGLLMALAWVRLQAPDIALAEAAIGAGLTGALLLDAVGQMSSRRAGQNPLLATRDHVSRRESEQTVSSTGSRPDEEDRDGS